MPPATTAAPASGTADPLAQPSGGLRERKKQETRRAIHRAALELANDHGVDGITVEEIADRAGVSPRTFFNYFVTKDDAIIGSVPGDLEELSALVAHLAAGDRPRAVVRTIAHQRVAALERDPETWAMRRALTLDDPSLGLRFLGVYARADRVLVDAMVERARAAAGGVLSADEELALAVETHAALGAVRAAVRAHLGGGHDASLSELVDRAFALL